MEQLLVGSAHVQGKALTRKVGHRNTQNGGCSSQTSWAAASDVHENFLTMGCTQSNPIMADIIIARVRIREGEKG